MALGDPVRIVAPTIVRVTYKHQLTDGKKADSVVDISLDEFGVGRDTAVANMITHVSAPWQQYIVDMMANNVSYLGGNYIDLDSLGGTTGTFGPAAGQVTVGQDNNPMAPPNTCYLIHKNTASRRGQRPGRLYMPGPTNSTMDENGVVTGTKITTINGRFSSYDSAIQSIAGTISITSTRPRVVHIDRHGSPDPAVWTWSSSDVSSWSCDTVVATQRRRLRG